MRVKVKNYLLAKIALGVIVFISTAGVVLGISILLGVLKTPLTGENGGNEQPTQSGQTGVVYADVSKTPWDLFPYETEEYKVIYSDEKIIVYLHPSLKEQGPVNDQITAIKSEVNSWLSSNGIDPDKSTIEWRTK